MSFLKAKKTSTALAGPHRVRIQMSNSAFAVATFELPCNVYNTPISEILQVAGENLRSQAATSGHCLEGGLFCNNSKFEFTRNGSSLYMNTSQVPKILDLSQTPANVGINNGGTLYVIGSNEVESLLMTATQRYDSLRMPPQP